MDDASQSILTDNVIHRCEEVPPSVNPSPDSFSVSASGSLVQKRSFADPSSEGAARTKKVAKVSRCRAVRLVNRLRQSLLFRLLFLVLLSMWVCPRPYRQCPHATGLVSSSSFLFCASLPPPHDGSVHHFFKCVWPSGSGQTLWVAAVDLLSSI